MEIQEIVKPSYIRTPNLITGEKNIIDDYVFACVCCGLALRLNYEIQIRNSLIGKGDDLKDEEVSELTKFYRIGIANKSHDGGSPVFDKIKCASCDAIYYTYVGIAEPLNSCYHVQVQGILSVK